MEGIRAAADSLRRQILEVAAEIEVYWCAIHDAYAGSLAWLQEAPKGPPDCPIIGIAAMTSCA